LHDNTPSTTRRRPTRAEQDALRDRVVKVLEGQGFDLARRTVSAPWATQKDDLRRLHSEAVAHRRDRGRAGLKRHQDRLLRWIADGSEVSPTHISPRLVEVTPDSDEELLFRFAALHWSIPVSSGYGRRVRFTVFDAANQKLIGIIGLGDPVFNLAARDNWIGWSRDQRAANLHHVMEAFVVGAVPPYSRLLGGKLIAMLLASSSVQRAFHRRYAAREAVISRRRLPGRLALITTQSALGRSSIYNRVRYGDRLLLHPVGFTAGYGEFHFSNGLYTALSEYAQRYCEPTAKTSAWGTGYRNRREVIKKALVSIGLPTDWIHHGICREVFAVPLAEQTCEFLRDETTRPRWLNASTAELSNYWLDRWVLPRLSTRGDFRAFDKRDYRLWT
jgi:hypothetical protein